MTINLAKHKDELLFLPLGGSGEIGMNLNLYHLNGKWLMVDCGAGFAEDYLPGVDMIVPDIEFLLENKHNLLGLVITHAHEDHLGGIGYLWDQIGCPIYATPFTAEFLKAKLSESRFFDGTADIREVAVGSQFNIGPFDIEMVELTHSVPEMNAVVLRTPHGNIFHSGDWKLDPDPKVGPVSDEKKITRYGDEGVLAYIGDSTNVFSPGHTGSEGQLRESLHELIAQCENLVMVTTFASNVARVESIIKVADACGRKVVLAGRSLWRIVHAAKAAGYLQDCPEIYEDDALSRFRRDELLILCTGCQGEPLAATNKIINGSHRSIALRPEDTIIFSSKIIPGNEKRIFRQFNKLAKLGATVLTEKDHFVHVSGHPNREDMKRMYEMVRPKYSLPVHGEDVHMLEHCNLAQEWGVEKAIKMENGLLVRLAPGVPEKLCLVDSGVLAVDGNSLLPLESPIFKARRRLQTDGVVFVSLLLNKNGLHRSPMICAPGVLDAQQDAAIIHELVDEVEIALDELFNNQRSKKTWKRVEQVVRSAIRRIIRMETGKEPMIEVAIDNI